MFKQWFAFSKRATACVVLSATFALTALAEEKSKKAEVPQLPTYSLVFSDRAKSARVGDAVSYTLEGAEPHLQVDPKEGSLKNGFLFKPGKIYIPLVAAKYQIPSLSVIDAEGKVVGRTDPTEFEAASNLSEEERQKGPKPEPAIGPLGLPFPLWIQTAIGTLILVVLVIAGFYIARAIKRRAAKALKSILPKKAYDVATLERLDAALKKGWLEKQAFKPFYFSVSETLKFYLGERFDFDAQESTTSELFAFLQEKSGSNGLSDSIISRIRKLFDAMDPVKFADQIPSEAEARNVQREAVEIVVSTRKAPEKVGEKR